MVSMLFVLLYTVPEWTCNAQHFSILKEYLCFFLNRGIGTLLQELSFSIIYLFFIVIIIISSHHIINTFPYEGFAPCPHQSGTSNFTLHTNNLQQRKGINWLRFSVFSDRLFFNSYNIVKNFFFKYFCALSQRVYGQSNVYNCIDNRIISLCCVRFFRFCTLTQGVYVQIRFKNNKPNLNSQTNNLMK